MRRLVVLISSVCALNRYSWIHLGKRGIIWGNSGDDVKEAKSDFDGLMLVTSSHIRSLTNIS